MTRSTYVIALGSNRRGRHGGPEREVAAALALLGDTVATSPVFTTPPLGPSHRRFANAVAVIESNDTPAALLARLKRIEQAFGRRRGRRWGARVIDLDIILWSGGIWVSPGLAVPHPRFRERAFVLDPLAATIAGWRDPVSALTIRQLRHRLTRRAPCAVDRGQRGS